MKRELLLASLALCSWSSWAVEPESVDSLINLKGVVVSANKIAVNRNSVPMTVSVIGREQIESSSESALLPVLSQHVPGLFVTEKGMTGFGVSSGSAGTVNIRGVGQGNKVLMLFDGQPQWAGVFGHALPDTYVASDVERVEVIRGPGSLLYGSNAMGGVVNIITRQHKQPGRRTQARVMYGSYNTQKYMLNNGYNVGNFSSFVSINHDRTDGHRVNSKFDITNGFLNVGYRLGNHYKLSGNLSLAKYNTEDPGTLEAPLLDHVMHILRGTTSAALENHHEKSSGALRLFYNWGHHKINDGHAEGEAPRSFLFKSDDHNAGLQLYQSFRLVQGNTFTVGVDYKNWGGHAWNDSIRGPRGEVVDRTVHEVAGYAIAQQDLWNVLSLNAGVRYEHSSAYGSEWVPQAGFSLRLLEGNTVKGSFSKGYRSPTLRELYISYLPFSKANPDLKPESMLSYELSVGQSFWEERLFAELTAFYIEGKDMISVMNRQMNNVGRFYNKGIEFETSIRPCRSFAFDLNYSYLDMNKAIVAAPAHKLYAGATWQLHRWDLHLDMQSIFDLYTYVGKTPEEARKEDYTLLNARVAYRLGQPDKGMKLFVKGENLTATRYTINDGYPMPKATFMGGIEVTF